MSTRETKAAERRARTVPLREDEMHGDEMSRRAQASYSVLPNEEVQFKVHHEDADVLVIGKPAHLVTQPGLGHESDSLLNGLFARWGKQLQNLGKARDFGLLHRLDRETSGLLVVALTASAYDGLRAAFRTRDVRKYYWALIKGCPSPHTGVIRRPIAESEGRSIDDAAPTHRSSKPAAKKLARISGLGKPAITAYRVLRTGRLGSLVECRAVTGRLHQIRVHLESIGCPVLGDGLYATRPIAAASPRLALHAHRLVFNHPITGVKIDVSCGWPTDLKRVAKRLKLAEAEVPKAKGPKSAEMSEADVRDEPVAEMAVESNNVPEAEATESPREDAPVAKVRKTVSKRVAGEPKVKINRKASVTAKPESKSNSKPKPKSKLKSKSKSKSKSKP